MMVSFRDRIKRGDRLLGAFIKTPSIHATEILAGIGFDFLIVDQEHGPFDATSLDTLALAGRASETTCLVRVADATPARMAAVLDMGFAGVVVPHVSSVEAARAAAHACRYRGGARGYTNSSRAGGYGAKNMIEHVDAADRSVTLVAMIEDAEALENLDEILSTEGIDSILVGRADLAVSLGETCVRAPAVMQAVARVLETAQRLEVRTFVFAGDVAEAAPFPKLGVTGFIIGSDQALLRSAALDVQASFKKMIVAEAPR